MGNSESRVAKIHNHDDVNCACSACKRLELLGRQVLKLVLTDYLFSKYPEDDVFALLENRAALLSTTNLNKIAREFEPQSSEVCVGEQSVLRLLGIIYLGCGGLEAARNRVLKLWGLDNTEEDEHVNAGSSHPVAVVDDHQAQEQYSTNKTQIIYYAEPADPPEVEPEEEYWDQYVGCYSSD